MSIPVRAKELGFHGGKLRPEGDEFDVDSILDLGRWMERKDDGPNKGEEGFQALFDAALAAREKKAAKAAPQGRRRPVQEPSPIAPKDGDEGGTTSNQDVI